MPKKYEPLKKPGPKKKAPLRKMPVPRPPIKRATQPDPADPPREDTQSNLQADTPPDTEFSTTLAHVADGGDLGNGVAPGDAAATRASVGEHAANPPAKAPRGKKKAKAARDDRAEAAASPPARAEKPPAAVSDKPKCTSLLDAAVLVLDEADEPLRMGEIMKRITERGLWSSPRGQTPHATLYVALIREIAMRGEQSRVRKVDRGLFAHASFKAPPAKKTGKKGARP